MIEELFLWVIAVICLALPTWIIYYFFSKNITLNKRINNCDDTLLTDPSVKIEQIVAAPEGTVITENAQVVFVNTNQSNQTI